MTPVGMILTFGAYALGVWGYCLVRSYDVPFSALWQPTWPSATANPKAPVKPNTGMSGTTAQAEGA
jgi:hypothetical protein